jgi:hypothetical protein
MKCIKFISMYDGGDALKIILVGDLVLINLLTIVPNFLHPNISSK